MVLVKAAFYRLISSQFICVVYLQNNVINSGLDCHIGGMSVCILLYADDLVILVPSWLAQQKLLNVCNECVLSLRHEI